MPETFIKKGVTPVLFFVLAVLSSVLCHSDGRASEELLVGTDELGRLLNAPAVRIIDAGDPALYGRAHLPGAVNIFYQRLSDIKERKLSGHPLPAPEAEKVFGDAGIGPDTRVVVYDDGEGVFASGVWFVLRFFGHSNVQVLDGGFRKWMAETRPVSQAVPKFEKKKFQARPDPAMVVTKEWVNEKRSQKDVVILDTRSVREFIGDEVRAGASRGGHIPGALHLEWTHATDTTRSFRPAEELEALFRKHGITRDKTVVTYCHSGLGRSTKLAMALKLLGFPRVLEYTGSWEEWSGDPRLPIER